MPNFPPPVATSRVHKMRFGAEATDHGTRFKIWAPRCKDIRLKLKGRRALIALERQHDGWHRKEVEGVVAGAHYRYVLPDGTEIADPASRHQPADIDSYSEVISLVAARRCCQRRANPKTWRVLKPASLKPASACD